MSSPVPIGAGGSYRGGSDFSLGLKSLSQKRQREEQAAAEAARVVSCVR